jgi:hypothetical protein
MKSQHDSILTLRAKKQALWIHVKAAKQAGSTDEGVADFEQIITLKDQIIQAKQQILALHLQTALSFNERVTRRVRLSRTFLFYGINGILNCNWLLHANL